MAMEAAVALPLLLFLLFSCCCSNNSLAQTPIPRRPDGFVYEGDPLVTDSIEVDAFLDPLCPDSRDSWMPLKQAVEFYFPRLSLVVHPFPLPFGVCGLKGHCDRTVTKDETMSISSEKILNDCFTDYRFYENYHNNAFLACRALHIANNLNESSTFPLLELFFKYQEKYYNAPTQNMSRASIIDDMAKLAGTVVGSSLSEFLSGFQDSETDTAARISFKYGCSRGVSGAPFFFVNGFLLPNYGSALDYLEWRRIIDPILGIEVSDHVFSY